MPAFQLRGKREQSIVFVVEGSYKCTTMKCISIESYLLLNVVRLFVDVEKFSIYIPGKAFSLPFSGYTVYFSLSDVLLLHPFSHTAFSVC